MSQCWRNCGGFLTHTRPLDSLLLITRHESTLDDCNDHILEKHLSDEKSFHMTPDEFRRYGHAVVDWIADYQSRVESFPVLSQAKPGQIRAGLPKHPPGKGENFDAILKDIEPLILPR